MSRREKIDLIRETVKTGRGRSIAAIPKGSGYLTWDELQEILKGIPRTPIPESLIPIVDEWVKEYESEAGKDRLKEIEAEWRSFEKTP